LFDRNLRHIIEGEIGQQLSTKLRRGRLKGRGIATGHEQREAAHGESQDDEKCELIPVHLAAVLLRL
jgi:hypothetical protein